MILNPTIPFVIILIILTLILSFAIFCLFNKKLRKKRIFRRILMALLLIGMLARPGFAGGSTERDLSNFNLFFIVDNSGSMAVKDMDNYNKYRYEKASDDMKKIVNLFPGAKYSAIVLDYNVYQAMPLVSDTNTAYSFINAMRPKGSTYSSDSNLGNLLSYASDKIEKYTKRYPERKNLLFFFSDGEDADGKTSIPNSLKNSLSGGAVFGYGTVNGGKVPEIDRENTITNYSIKERIGNTDVISRLDESNLSSIAASAGLKYYRRSSSDDKYSDTKNFVSDNASYQRDDKKADVAFELYWIIALFIVALLIWEFTDILNTLLLERKATK